MSTDTKYPNFDDLFNTDSDRTTHPIYGQYQARGTLIRRPQYITVSFIVCIVSLLLILGGWYISSQIKNMSMAELNALGSMNMSAAESFNYAIGDNSEQAGMYTIGDPIWIQQGNAVAYMEQWYCPNGPVVNGMIDISGWLKDMDYSVSQGHPGN